MYVVLTKYLFAVHDTALKFSLIHVDVYNACSIAIGVIHHSADIIVLDVTANYWYHTNAEMCKTKSTCYVLLGKTNHYFLYFLYIESLIAP